MADCVAKVAAKVLCFPSLAGVNFSFSALLGVHRAIRQAIE
jgi:hypothetical protein